MFTGEREITEPVPLVADDGLLNPRAVGWTRRHLHDSSGLTAGRRGRNKRWEYWLVITPTHLLSMTVSDVDYAGSHSVWAYELATGRTLDRGVLAPFAVGTVMPPSLGDGPAIGGSVNSAGRLLGPGPGRVGVRVDPLPDGGDRLRAFASAPARHLVPGQSGAEVPVRSVRFDVTADRPAGHEALGVVVPWSATRFQYTVKDVARPARGWFEFDGVRHQIPEGESWAILDHGRGRWPYTMWWNWGAAVGRLADGRTVGLQFGGKWTDGTGSRENAIVVDGALFPLHEDLDWRYDPSAWLTPWRLRSESVDLVLHPFWDHAAVTDVGVLSMKAHQVFGRWSGTVTVRGERLPIDGVLGFAEDVQNRW